MLRFLAFGILLFSAFAASLQAETRRQVPAYTLDIAAGLYFPDDTNWANYYGSNNLPEAGISFAYRVFSVLDIGSSVSFGRDSGSGILPLSQLPSGKVSYDILPLEFYAVLRAQFSQKQWIVPYAGGGYSRFFYRQLIEGKTYARGSVNGMHLKAGLQFLLDPLDVKSAMRIYQNYGVINSYLVFEGKITRAQTHAPVVDLGGRSYRLGIKFEY